MNVNPQAFLRCAIEMGLLSPGAAAEAGAWLREARQRGEAVSVDRHLLARGLLDTEGIGRIVRELRRSGKPAAPGEGTKTGTVQSAGSCESGTGSGSVPPASGAVSLPGERYRLQHVLGRGGMGEVWLALDGDIGREVAVKRMLSAEEPERVHRFLFEAQVTGQLEHPGIVPVYELGGTKGESGPFLAMKRIRGRSLAQVLDEIRAEDPTRDREATGARSSAGTRRRERRGRTGRTSRLSPPAGAATRTTLHRLLEVFLKVCDAIAYAHSRGVLHRDLKPANIMVGEFGEVLVVDWGLAKVLGRSASPGAPPVRTARGDDTRDPFRTREGDISGTPMYMPPEQARGEIGKLDPRSDVYSLGAVLYEILSLAPPFEGGSLVDLLTSVTRGSWRPPLERSVAPWPIPRELEAVVTRAMALDQEDRYASAMELRADVEAYLAGRTLAAAEYSPWEVLVKWARRHKTAVIGGAATAAAVVLGIAGTVAGIAWSRRAEADRIREERIARAEDLHARAFPSREKSALPFNAADPQPFFLERLPVVVTLGQAIHEHPEPPGEWRRELALSTGELQAKAEAAADWALAEHLALSAAAWGGVTESEGRERLARTRRARADRVAADLARLDDLRHRIREAEGKEPQQGGLLPGEMLERARQARAIQSRSEVVVRLVEDVGRDNERLRQGSSEGRLARFDRLFCATGDLQHYMLAPEELGEIKDRCFLLRQMQIKRVTAPLHKVFVHALLAGDGERERELLEAFPRSLASDEDWITVGGPLAALEGKIEGVPAGAEGGRS
ncbi:MAG: serine/threonine protein kinase [Planctomycetes bacterium]|nr:serine/threonine protein kinase [Planctomycetota bacterium]